MAPVNFGNRGGIVTPPTSGVFDRMALIAAPWPLFNRPSIQLGALKAYIHQRCPGLTVEAHHFYLELAAAVGYRLYSAISERSWLAESVYAALLYPERVADAETLFRTEARGQKELQAVDFKKLTETVGGVTGRFLGRLDWNRLGLAGFSICLCQLTASLFLIRSVRQAAPGLPVVIGGSIVAGPTAHGLVRQFPQIDFAVVGEGERPLRRLVDRLRLGGHPLTDPPIAGVVTAADTPAADRPPRLQVSRLDGLPIPDYDDYFRLLRSLGAGHAFFPTIPLEISRGCWWQADRAGTRTAGCAFCNLNLQWTGYRTKSPKRAQTEIDAVTSAHQSLSVSYMDNLLPPKTSASVFERISRLDKDFCLFGEIRADTPAAVLRAMRSAGMSEVQIGIEALSSRLLKKLNKGTSAIQNIEIMKHCEALGIVHASNLIVYFPGSDRQDVTETLRSLSFVHCYRPLRFVHFWLGAHSPVWMNPEKYGIRAVANHPYYRRIFPPAIADAIPFTIQSYRGDRTVQRKLWQPVKQQIRSWKRSYGRLHAGPRSGPILGYRDGGRFMIIRQRRNDADAMTHRLKGTSRAIYLYCEHHRSLRSIVARFADFGEVQIVPFLKMMVDKKLMFEENNRYLSLAVPLRAR